MSSPRSTSRSKAKKARFAPRWSFSVDWSSWKLGLPLSSSATASPSIRQPAGSFAAALTSARNLSLQSFPLRVQAVAAPVPVAISSR